MLSPATRVERWYDSFFGTAMKFSDGDTQKADYFLDCTVNQFYYRVQQKINYFEWMKEQNKAK